MSVISSIMLGEDKLEPFWSGLYDRIGELSSVRADRPGKKDRMKFDPGIKNLHFVAGLSEGVAWFEIRIGQGFPDPEIILSKADELSSRVGCTFVPNAETKRKRALRAEMPFDSESLDAWEYAYSWFEKVIKISSMVCIKQCRRAAIVV